MSSQPWTATEINRIKYLGNTDDQSWTRRRNCRAARSATVEIQVDEQAAAAADNYSMGSSSTAFPDIFESSEFFTTIGRVKALEEEEYAEDRPSAFALETAMSALTRAAQFLTREFPRGSASVGAGQGMRLTWRLPMGEIRLIVDGAKASKSYIYVEPRNADSYIENTISGDKLAGAIRG